MSTQYTKLHFEYTNSQTVILNSFHHVTFRTMHMTTIKCSNPPTINPHGFTYRHNYQYYLYIYLRIETKQYCHSTQFLHILWNISAHTKSLSDSTVDSITSYSVTVKLNRSRCYWHKNIGGGCSFCAMCFSLYSALFYWHLASNNKSLSINSMWFCKNRNHPSSWLLVYQEDSVFYLHV